MINYLPPLYPDELVYSWFCRCYVHSGYLTHKDALKDILYKRCNNPSKEFLGHLNSEMQKKIQAIYPLEKLILQHTMFPQYARFIPLENKKKAMYHLIYDFRDVHHLFSVLPRTDTARYLKYCPLCAEEDKQKFGETYWHRKHQMRGMQVCYKHNCLLENSDITAKSEQTFTFCPAEMYAELTIPQMANDDCKKFSEYMATVFDSTFDFENPTPISAILYYALENTKYLATTGRTRNTQQLADDLKKYYKTMGIDSVATINQLHRLWSGNIFDFSVVCQVAYFLGMSTEELTNTVLTSEQIEVEQKTHYTKDKIRINWKQLDDKLAPQLKAFAYEIYHGTADKRPQRVSERLVYREFNLHAHSLEKLPKCQSILREYSETYEENWTRRLVWAYEKLKSERNHKHIYWSDIRKLSGVKKEAVYSTV